MSEKNTQQKENARKSLVRRESNLSDAAKSSMLIRMRLNSKKDLDVNSERSFNKLTKNKSQKKLKKSSFIENFGSASFDNDKESDDRTSGRNTTMPRSQVVRGSRVARKVTSLYEMNSNCAIDDLFDEVDKQNDQENGEAKNKFPDNKSVTKKGTKAGRKKGSSFSLNLNIRNKHHKEKLKQVQGRIGSARSARSARKNKNRIGKQKSTKHGSSVLMEYDGYKTEEVEGKPDKAKKKGSVVAEETSTPVPAKPRKLQELDADATLLAYASNSYNKL